MDRRYFHQYHADINTDNVTVSFERLFEDTRDQMCDSLAPQWEARDEFIIDIIKKVTSYFEDPGAEYSITYKKIKELDRKRIFCKKNLANRIWQIAKKYDSYDTILNYACII